jgi:hypothetical protein
VTVELKPCGTYAAYRRHIRHGERPDYLCSEANRIAEQDRGAADSERTQARRRDVPGSCICRWEYMRPAARWIRAATAADCPWHQGRAALS